MEITLVSPVTLGKLNLAGEFLIDDAGNQFKLAGEIPIFVSESNYATNFGFQWNKFTKTQIDSASRRDSSLRFWSETGWRPADLAGKRVLEVGSGAGRFTSVIMRESDAVLASIDLSDAVYANRVNNNEFILSKRLFLAQASIYDMPFANDYFDNVFCFGVLQHTPDFKKALHSLYLKLNEGGELVVDFYPIKGWWTKLNAKYFLRPIMKRLSNQQLLKLIRSTSPAFIKIYNILNHCGLHVLTRFLPICDIKSTLNRNLGNEELLENVVLDTFDMYSPEYDNPQRIELVSNWLSEFGAQITFAGFVSYGTSSAAVVRCKKPSR